MLVAVWTHPDPTLRTISAPSASPAQSAGRAANMARLATLIIEKKGLFFPVLDYGIMLDPSDKEKPGTFLELFPHRLSRLFMVLLWKINFEQEGDGALQHVVEGFRTAGS